jgi:hypothetical protein
VGRTRAYVVLAVVLGVVLSPIVSGKDSYPHSTYPMFASTPGREATLQVAFGLDAADTLVRLGPRTISGSVEVVHAYATLLAACARRSPPGSPVVGRRPWRPWSWPRSATTW